MNYIVLDLEFNQSFPFKSGKKVEPNPECPFEIIQIGAVKLNERFEQLDTFDAMIRPQIYPRLHPFVEKITGIRAETKQKLSQIKPKNIGQASRISGVSPSDIQVLMIYFNII